MEWINTNPINVSISSVWTRETIDKNVAQLATEYVDILNQYYKNDMTYVPTLTEQRHMIIQEIWYGLTWNKKGITKESIFKYASHSINNFGMIKLMNEWYPKLEYLQEMYKARERYKQEYKLGQDTNTTTSSYKDSGYSV
jgi:hypothetical protein